MAGELRVIREAIVEVDGEEVLQHGSRVKCFKAVAVDGSTHRKIRFDVAANTEVVLWTYAAGSDFMFASIEISGDGELRWKGDKATSTSDRTAAGTHVNWMRKKMSCYAPEHFHTNEMRVASTVADQVNAAAGGASMADGYIYEIRIKNNSSTATMTALLIMVDD